MATPDITYIKGKMLKLSKLLYPRARAYIMPNGGLFERVHKAIASTQAQLWLDGLLILDSTIADNPNFTADDATLWEARLAILSGGSAVSLSDRMGAINRKMGHPGTSRPRQSPQFMTKSLQAAGFNVTVYENRFPDGFGGYITMTPEEILGSTPGAAYHRSSAHHGAIFHGALFSHKIVNHLEADKDSGFAVGDNYRSTFYVASNTVSTFADVPASRELEFRQLLLQLKPAQTVGFLFVNYI